ncbi:hypothetical protein P9E76_01405 [Schinkia azotoformans]|uniref:Uncharacterized protein n=1 Tax=Schinkia azotoformans LMG 9581 TaxID=1131731 RepID=K6C8U0_SCHAZ|nr:hypothetical protein [Schinkia azotoformans]EKN67510.1 hypothetical protein BAZO_08471 [Schinkia azotoformans LMG 9581]MEC1637330.1 hypothetical protein [Schinkia azotoformans]MEC1943734.1 hypothetical protein [Schinkia azotoformans]
MEIQLKESPLGFLYEETEIKTDAQIAMIKKFYDWKYHTELKYKKAKIIAEVYDYLDNFVEDYNGDIIFEYEDNQITVQAVNGVAEIDFVADEGLECTVRTVIPNFRNGEVTFNV